jgi:hypothetical protein
MDDTAKLAAEARTLEAIASGPYDDFREAYRDRLRWLKEARPQAFSDAVGSYERLVESVAAGADPIDAWLEYGKQLGDLSGRGRVVRIDETGREVPATGTGTEMLLHLPDDINVPALPLAIPRAPSEAQKATLDLLVHRRLALGH